MEKLLKEKVILEQKIKDAIEDFINETNKTPEVTIEIEETTTKCGGDVPLRFVSVKSEVLI